MQSSPAQRGQGPCPGHTAVPSRAKLDPGKGRGLPPRPDPHRVPEGANPTVWPARGSGVCRTFQPRHVPRSAEGDGGAGPYRTSWTCSLKKRCPGEGVPGGRHGRGQGQETGWPRDSERPQRGGARQEEAGRPGEAAGRRGLGPGLSLQRGEELACPEP